jgi:hypothetical protein
MRYQKGKREGVGVGRTFVREKGMYERIHVDEKRVYSCVNKNVKISVYVLVRICIHPFLKMKRNIFDRNG